MLCQRSGEKRYDRNTCVVEQGTWRIFLDLPISIIRSQARYFFQRARRLSLHGAGRLVHRLAHIFGILSTKFWKRSGIQGR
jgi:hypothetical protein